MCRVGSHGTGEHLARVGRLLVQHGGDHGLVVDHGHVLGRDLWHLVGERKGRDDISAAG